MFLYQRAATMLLECFNGKGINNVLYENRNASIGKLSRILHKALERLETLEEIYEEHLSDFCKNKCLGIILLSVYLDRSKIDGGGKIKRRILEKKEQILEMYEKLKEKNCEREKAKHILPKYFILYGDKEIKKKIKKELQKTLSIEKDNDIKQLYKIKAADTKQLITSSFYKNGKIRILDKSSCLVVKAGNIQKGSVIVDVCSSPGSKAIFSVLQLKKKGFLICIEKDKKRCLTLIKEFLKNEELMGLYTNESCDESTRITVDDSFVQVKAKKSNKNELTKKNIKKEVYFIKHKNNALFIKIYNCDFFDLTAEDFPNNVDIVYIDPSCSSSGMPDFFLKQNIDNMSLFKKKENLSQNGLFPNCSKGIEKAAMGKICSVDKTNIVKEDKRNEPEKVFYDKETYTDANKKTNGNSHICDRKPPVHIVPEELKGKVEMLSVFQKKILEHALHVITSAHTFIYSTCSFFEEENEQVIEHVLKKNNRFYLEKAGDEQFLLNNENYPFSKKCVRTYPNIHSCRGIFIAKLLRKT